MLLLSLLLYLAGFGVLLVDARMGEGYSLPLAAFAGVMIAGAMIAFIGGLMKPSRLDDESPDSLP